MLKPNIIDLSHHETVETGGFAKLEAAGFKGVILKATEGLTYVDPTFVHRKRDLSHTSLRVAAYHFARNADPIRQADRYLDVAQLDDDMLAVLDWESAVGARGKYADTFSVSQARAFLDRVMHRTGRPPEGIWIYGGNVPKELIRSAEDRAYFGRFPLWLCQYGATPVLPKAWDRYAAWQFTGDGRGPLPHTAPGVFHPKGLDLNVAREGFDFEREWGACRWALPPPPDPAPAPVVAAPTPAEAQTAPAAVAVREASLLSLPNLGKVGAGGGGVLLAGELFVNVVNQAKGVSDAIKTVEADLTIVVLLGCCLLALAGIGFYEWGRSRAK